MRGTRATIFNNSPFSSHNHRQSTHAIRSGVRFVNFAFIPI